MISVYNLKTKFQQLLKPVLTLLNKWGVTANMITWSAVLLSTLTGAFIFIHPYGISYLLLPFVLFVRMALNALDGMMARTYNMQSKKGEILNELGDVISDLVLFYPLTVLFSVHPYLLHSFLFLSIINEYTGILGKAVSGERRYEGPMGKSDRALLIGILSLLFYFHKISGPFLPLHFIEYCFIGAIILLLISTWIRIQKTIKQP